jgi:hypothetical protein
LWHLWAVRFSLPASVFLILALAGCATPQQKAERAQKKTERQMASDTTRTVEHLRMMRIENGEAQSTRGAEIVEYDPTRTFDPNAHTASAARSYGTKGATTKNYNPDRQLRVDTYQTRDFYDAKPNPAAERKFATNEANSKGKYAIPNVGKAADTRTAATKEAWDANKVAASRPVSDGRRQYLGPESKKLGTTTDAKELANWRNAGETVVYSDGAVEKVSTLKSLSIDDIRELLNKSK